MQKPNRVAFNVTEGNISDSKSAGRVHLAMMGSLTVQARCWLLAYPEAIPQSNYLWSNMSLAELQ